MTADQIVHRRAGAAIGHVHDVDLGHALEQLAGEMVGRADAGRGEIDLAGLLRASAISSCTLLAGTPGLTISTIGAIANSAIGAKSLAGS